MVLAIFDTNRHGNVSAQLLGITTQEPLIESKCNFEEKSHDNQYSSSMGLVVHIPSGCVAEMNIP
jgi:hypothetical protein